MENGVYLLSAGLEFFFAAISVVLLIGCFFDHDSKRLSNRIMIAMFSINAFMNSIDACIWLWCEVPELRTLMKVLSFLSYGLGCAIFVMFAFLLINYIREYAEVPSWIPDCALALGAIMATIWGCSLFNDSIYYWDENGSCFPGELFFTSQVFGILFLVLNMILLWAYRKALPKKDRFVLMLYNLIPLSAFAFVPFWDVVPLYMAATLALLLYYMVIHIEHGTRMAEQKTLLARQELELADNRTVIMLSQIRPHFLYNALTAIAQLCEKNPVMAKEAIIKFANYLRENMNALNAKEPVPFERELEHIKNYLSIEQVRFGDDLKIEYAIDSTDFVLPTLCLQPIVENAVKHGVGMNEDGGTVIISTAELDDCYEITVSDDGVGFDVNSIPNDGKAHIGIHNARERLKLIGAELSVDSEPGRGTRACIKIPKGRTEQ